MLKMAKKLIAMAASATLLLSACLRLPPTETPIPKIESIHEHAAGRSLIIMLPGVGDRAGSFAKQEFTAIAGQHGFDTVAVDAHLGYYQDRSLLTRMREDVVRPARAIGYEDIWLLGISMGGFGALSYAHAHPEDIDGLILLAPWLGGDTITDDVRAAPSLAAWRADGIDSPAYEIDVWQWLQQETNKPEGKPIVLAYGTSDRLAGSYAPLLEVIPASRTHTRNGGHKWTTWRPLWQNIAAQLASGSYR